jgi:diguanylate cyclase (GGDEF)-like protein
MALRETDIHTGLHTPGFLVAYGARAMSKTGEKGGTLILLTIGIECPDDPGPEIPAAIFRRIGEHIRRSVGQDSLVARIGDSELAVLLMGKDIDYAMGVAHSIRESIDSAGDCPGGSISVSIGVASSTDSMRDFGELIRASQVAMEQWRES